LHGETVDKARPAVDFRMTLLYTRGVRKKLVAVRLKPQQVARLGKLALSEDVPISWLIRKAIDEFLKRWKK
jgi:hypothetical protein